MSSLNPISPPNFLLFTPDIVFNGHDAFISFFLSFFPSLFDIETQCNCILSKPLYRCGRRCDKSTALRIEAYSVERNNRLWGLSGGVLPLPLDVYTDINEGSKVNSIESDSKMKRAKKTVERTFSTRKLIFVFSGIQPSSQPGVRQGWRRQARITIKIHL